MLTPPAAAPGWRTKLPFHSGNRLQQQQPGPAGKQGLVERPIFSNSTFKEQSSKCSGPRKAQEWLSSDGRTFSLFQPPDDGGGGGDDDNETIATSMVAHIAAAPSPSSDVTDDHESVATPRECVSDQFYVVEDDAANYDDFRGIGDCFDIPKSRYIGLTTPFNRDANAEDHQHWKSLAPRHDEATQDGEHTSFKEPHASSPFEPAPSLVTDCSTVESDTIATHQYLTGAYALPLDGQDNQHARPPKPCSSTTNKPVNVEEVGRSGTLHPHLQEVPLGTPTQHTGQRSGGRGGRGGPGRGRGGRGTKSSSTSHTHSASSDSNASSSQPDGNLKRQRGDDEEDDGPERDGQDDKEPSKRARSNGADNIRLACPFLRRDPEKYFDCMFYHLQTTGSLKQHLKRCHSPPIRCPVCGEEFKTRALCDQHGERQDCPKKDIAKYDISEDQQRQLERPCPRNTDERGRWFHIWDILFPNQEDQRLLDPFQGSPLLEARVVFCTMFSRSLPDMVCMLVGNGWSEITAQAISRDVGAWVQQMGEGAINLSSASPEASRAHVGDGTSQESPNNSTPVHFQAGNSGLPHESMPATDPTPSQVPLPLANSILGQPGVTPDYCYFPDMEHNHDSLCLPSEFYHETPSAA